MMILSRLILAHFIADFTFQTNRVACWKRQSRWGMAVHVLTHPVVTTVLLWPFLTQPWVVTPWFSLPGWVCVIVISMIHWIEDEWRVWMIRSGWPDTTGLLLWDQIVHWAVIYAIAPREPGIPAEPWVGVTLCAVLLAHVVSVLIFFLENDAGGPSQVLMKNKYRFIGERLVGASLLLLPGMAGALGVVAIGVWMAWAWKRPQIYTHVHVAVAAFSTLTLGLVARSLL